MNARELLEPFRFHREHAGYSVPPGRAACALEAARAEILLRRAVELGAAAVEWQDDEIPYDPGLTSEEEARRLFETGKWTGPYGCRVRVATARLDDEEETSLWGIVTGPEGERDPYRRVVEAELASELLDELRAAVARAELAP
jgi:hypothetical protein